MKSGVPGYILRAVYDLSETVGRIGFSSCTDKKCPWFENVVV